MHAPHNMWPAPLYSIFPHCYKRHDFLKKKVTEHEMCVLISYTTFVWKIYHFKKNWARNDKKCIMVFMKSIPYFYPILMKLFSRVFRKYSNIKFHENSSSASRILHSDRHDVANSRFSQTRLITAILGTAHILRKVQT